MPEHPHREPDTISSHASPLPGTGPAHSELLHAETQAKTDHGTEVTEWPSNRRAGVAG